MEWKSLLYVCPDIYGNIYSFCLETFFELISSHGSDISEREPDCTFKADKGNIECFSTNILFRGEATRNVCNYSTFLSTRGLWASDVQSGTILAHWLSKRPSCPLKAVSSGAAALTNAFCLLWRGAMDCILLGFISYLMQCNQGDRINQRDDTILDLKDERFSKVIAECIFQCC